MSFDIPGKMSSFVQSAHYKAASDYAQHYPTTTACLVAGITVYVGFKLYGLVLAAYRIYFHPLSKFSGPPKARISQAWLNGEVSKGFAEKAFEEQHKKYSR